MELLVYLLDKVLLIVGFFGVFKFINFDIVKIIVMRYFYLMCYRMLGINYDELMFLNSELKGK